MSEREPDRIYVLTERQFIESVLTGAAKFLPPGMTADAQRCMVQRAENGVVLQIWVGEKDPDRYLRTVPLEPQVLVPLLKQFSAQMPAGPPTLTEVKAWPEADLLEVSNWVRALHAHATPITGMALPEIPDQPAVLFEVRPEESEPAPAKPKRASRKKVQRDPPGGVDEP